MQIYNIAGVYYALLRKDPGGFLGRGLTRAAAIRACLTNAGLI